MSSSLSIAEKLLLAAYDLEQRGKTTFSAEDLVVAAWKSFPEAFGLAGYRSEDGRPAYPDSNRVFAEIMGTKPIRNRGLIVKVGTKMYQLTEAGRRQARALIGRDASPGVARASLDRKVAGKLRALLESKALGKMKDGRGDELTFHDACAFWGISPRSSANDFHARVADFEAVVDAARRVVEHDDASFEHGGQAFGYADIEALMDVHKELLVRFEPELSVIQKRKDERI